MESHILYALLILLQVFFIIQLYYILIVQGQLKKYQKAENQDQSFNEPVSVIICARNEASNLRQNLPAVFAQKDIDFEVVVVNDCSNDDSHDVLLDLKRQYARLKVVEKTEHPRFKTGKKFAVTLGIKAAANEILVFTDADCKPQSGDWLRNICAHYQNPETKIVLGYSPYQKLSGFLNRLIRYETFQTALNYFSFALNRMPYMGVGRNLSYKKSLFFKGKGFAAHMHIPSGDDDLFVNQNATPGNTAIEIDPRTHIESEPKKDWKSYWNQKMRHLGAGKIYKKKHQQQLGLLNGSGIAFYLLLIACLIWRIEPVFVGILFAVRWIILLFTYYKPLKQLKGADLMVWLVILDPIYYFFILLLSTRGLFRKKIVWR